MKIKKDKITMDELTKGYEKFIEGKELSTDGKTTFETTIKKATKVKPRGSK